MAACNGFDTISVQTRAMTQNAPTAQCLHCDSTVPMREALILSAEPDGQEPPALCHRCLDQD